MEYVSLAVSLIALILAVAAYVGYRALWDKRDLSELTTTLERLEHVVDRIDTATNVAAVDMATAREHSEKVAENLAAANSMVEAVAVDLASAQHRADTVVEGQPGEAADAGAQSEKTVV